MTQRTRYFLTGSVIVVVVGLSIGTVAYYNGGLLVRSSGGPSELAYMPADSTAVAFADVRAIMNSEFRQRLRQVLPTGAEKDKIQQEIGVDIERDIDSVLAGFTGDDPTKGGAVVLVRGRFNDATIEGTAVQHGAVAETYKGKRLLVMSGLAAAHAGTTGEPMGEAHQRASGSCLAFLEPGLIALGDGAAVKRAIDTRAGTENLTKNADLMKLVNDVQGSSNAWVVGRFDALSAHGELPQPVKDQLGAVQFFAVSAQINGGVSGMLRADARDDKAAEQLRDVVRGVLAAGKLMSGSDSRVDAVLNSIQLQGTGKTVSVSFAVPPEIFDILNGVAALKNIK